MKNVAALVLLGWCACGRESLESAAVAPAAEVRGEAPRPPSADLLPPPSNARERERDGEGTAVVTRETALEVISDEPDPSVDPCQELDAEACYRTGWNLAHPDANEPRWDEALPYLRSACDRDYAMSCGYLGLLYGNGVGVELHEQTALGFYTRACELGEAKVSCLNGALIMLGDEDLSPTEKRRALKWLERACEAEIAVACYDLAVFTDDSEIAGGWYRRACKLGDAESCNRIAKPARTTEPTTPSHSRWGLPSPPVLPE